MHGVPFREARPPLPRRAMAREDLDLAPSPSGVIVHPYGALASRRRHAA
jgi:hypothetical protein